MIRQKKLVDLSAITDFVDKLKPLKKAVENIDLVI
jgi:hypothetical protein